MELSLVSPFRSSFVEEPLLQAGSLWSALLRGNNVFLLTFVAEELLLGDCSFYGFIDASFGGCACFLALGLGLISRLSFLWFGWGKIHKFCCLFFWFKGCLWVVCFEG